MFDVPPKFYELCRLCLSSDGVKLSIFEEEGTQRNFADKILTCLSIAVRLLSSYLLASHPCISGRLSGGQDYVTGPGTQAPWHRCLDHRLSVH
jgi:hypothetical protein